MIRHPFGTVARSLTQRGELVHEAHRVASADRRLDRVDRQIFCDIVRRDAIEAYDVLAARLNIPPAAIGPRISRLRELGYIPTRPITAKATFNDRTAV